MISALPGSETAAHHITTTSETQQKKKLRIDATSVRRGRMRQRFSTSVLVTLAGGGGGRQNIGGVGGWGKEQRELCSCSG